LVTIAGSAGGFYPLYDLVGNLPRTLKSALAVMLHLGPRSALAETLAQRSQLTVREASRNGGKSWR
jgi:chemotaxis response regulator CheB